MAYMSQERKAIIAADIKPILKKYGIKATLAVDSHLAICLNIKSGSIDFIENYNNMNFNEMSTWNNSGSFLDKDFYIQVNHYHLHRHFNGKALEFLQECKNALNKDNHDNSDPMSDYFDVGWYIHINIGQWNKPYLCE